MPLFSSYTCFLVILSHAAFRPLAARNPTNQGERQLMLDRQSHQAAVYARNPLVVATSLIDP